MLRSFTGAVSHLKEPPIVGGRVRTDPRLILLGIFMVPFMIGLGAATLGIAYVLTKLAVSVGGSPLLSVPMFVIAVIAVYALLCVLGRFTDRLRKK